jgi:methionyl aminopeptidase
MDRNTNVLRHVDRLTRDGHIQHTSRYRTILQHYASMIGASEWDCAVAVNHEIAHLNNPHNLRNGDIVKVDSWFKVNGLWIDGAITTCVGKVASIGAAILIEATREALIQGVFAARTHNRLSDIGGAIEATADRYGVNIIRRLSGHGIGKELHMAPKVRNYYDDSDNLILKRGMRFAIEPLFTLGNGVLGEDWCTTDMSLASHFESTIIVTDDGGMQVYGAI